MTILKWDFSSNGSWCPADSLGWLLILLGFFPSRIVGCHYSSQRLVSSSKTLLMKYRIAQSCGVAIESNTVPSRWTGPTGNDKHFSARWIIQRNKINKSTRKRMHNKSKWNHWHHPIDSNGVDPPPAHMSAWRKQLGHILTEYHQHPNNAQTKRDQSMISKWINVTWVWLVRHPFSGDLPIAKFSGLGKATRINLCCANCEAINAELPYPVHNAAFMDIDGFWFLCRYRLFFTR